MYSVGPYAFINLQRFDHSDANSTEQVANGYLEETMVEGAKSTSVMGLSTASAERRTLDSLVQRLVQKGVAEIDAKYK